MKTLSILCLLVSAGAVIAAPPSKKNVNSYSRLWSDSPFTVKPPPPEKAEAVNEIDDWALGGVSPIGEGFMVTIVHKKNAGETQVIYPEGIKVTKGDEMEWLPRGTAGSFVVDRVEYGKDSWKDTSVFLSVGKTTGTVKFDEEKLAPTAAAPTPQPKGNRPPNATNNGSGAKPAANGGRAPRRRVLPPTPNQNNQNRGRRNR